MDIDRRRQEAAEYRRKPRLMEDDEIPPNIIKISEAFIEDEKISDEQKLHDYLMGNSGKRRRKDVNYSQDLMSERDWLKSIDEEIDEEDEMEVRLLPFAELGTC
jgi:hypothetical protein